MSNLFPLGITHYLIGGVLVGLGTALIFVFTGIRAGASGVLSSTWSWISNAPGFATLRSERGWRALFTLGLIAGAALWTLSAGESFITGVPLWRLIAGGFLVGLGTRVARGCTSGHGICGLSSLNRASLALVIVFMAVAIAVAHLVEALS